MAKSFLTPIAVLLLAQLPSFANAQAQIEVLDWIVPYPGPKNYTANAGDTITFIWEGDPLPHNVLIHPSMDCTMEDAIYVGATAAGTSYTFAETDGSPDGTDMFFSCDVDGGMGSHCSYGQNIIVTVFSDATPSETINDSSTVEQESGETPPAAEVVSENESTTEMTMDDSAGSSRTNSVASMAGLVGACLVLLSLA